MKVAAKATCIDEAGGCGSSFIDIYVQYNDHIYHHQIETSANTESNKDSTYLRPIDNKSDEKKAVEKKPAKMPTIADLDKEDDLKPSERDDNNEPIEDDDDTEDQEEGHYIGDIKGDLTELFDVKPKPAAPVEKASPAPSPAPAPSTQAPEQKPVAPAAPEKKPEVKTELKPETKKPEAKPEVKPVPPAPVKSEKSQVTPAKPAAPAPAPVTPPAEKPKAPAPKPEEKKTEVKPEPKPEPKSEVKPETKPAPEPEKEKEKESPLTSVTEISKKIYQVMGEVNSGFLKNALDLFDLTKKEKPAGFYIASPAQKQYYGSNELIYLIQKMGSFTLNKVPNYAVRIGTLSKQKGGVIYTTVKGKQKRAHRSHTNGVDADISYYFKNPSSQGQSALNGGAPRSDWLMETQWELYKMFNQTKLVDRIFIHRKLKKALCLYAISKGEITASMNEGLAFETLWRLQPRPSDHADHFHLRAKCSSIQQGCKPMGEPVRSTGCF
jgi:penicillin-insensitive murein endopeptidase